MTDGILVKLAALACGYKWASGVDKLRGNPDLWLHDVSTSWNPLTDDDRAFSVMLKAGISVNFNKTEIVVDLFCPQADGWESRVVVKVGMSDNQKQLSAELRRAICVVAAHKAVADHIVEIGNE